MRGATERTSRSSIVSVWMPSLRKPSGSAAVEPFSIEPSPSQCQAWGKPLLLPSLSSGPLSTLAQNELAGLDAAAVERFVEARTDRVGRWAATHVPFQYGIVGIIGRINLAERWAIPYYLDAGTGDTDFTWQAYLGLSYAFESFELLAGYRYLDWDFDDDEPAFSELDLGGPMLGARWHF